MARDRELQAMAVNMAPTFQALELDEVRTVHLLVLCVDFSDIPEHVPLEDIDDRIFGDHFDTVFDYYREMSKGRFLLEAVDLPSEIGYLRMSQPMSYYAGGNMGTGTYPRNLQRVAEEALLLADEIVDFNQYDGNGDGYVDGVLIVTSSGNGPFQLNFGLPGGIAWPLNSAMLLDGVRMNKFCLGTAWRYDPGDGRIGGNCHELGHHLFNLDDEYDYGMDSSGLGVWCIMSKGFALDFLTETESTSRLCACCLVETGFVPATPLFLPETQISLPAIVDSSVVYRVHAYPHLHNSEYFLLENRTQTSYEENLLGAGMAIYHIDENVDNNNNPWYPGHETMHYGVALEQADGNYDLEMTPFEWDPENGIYPENQGDDGDLYPGSSGNRAFTSASVPNSLLYDGTDLGFSITNISDPGPVMTFDFSYTPPPLLFNRLALNNSYPGPAAIHATDVDEDGDLDILTLSNLGNELTAWIWDGSGFAAQRVDSLTRPMDFDVADLDGDGDLDLACSARLTPNVVWYEHQGGATYTPHVIEEDLSIAQAICVADMDGDLDNDLVVLSSGEGQIVLYVNDGSGSFASSVLVDQQSMMKKLRVEDADGDGLPEVFVSVNYGEGSLIVLENQGGNAFNRRDIPLAFPGVDAFAFLHDAGNLPVSLILGSSTQKRMSRIDGFLGESPAESVIDRGYDRISSIAVHDLDGDGVEDILAGGITTDLVAWWKEDGEGGFELEYIGDQCQRAIFDCVDMDGDGDQDVLTVGASSSNVVYWQNVPLEDYNAVPHSRPSSLPHGIRIVNAYPNPFNEAIHVVIQLTQPGAMTVDVFNILGRRVARIDRAGGGAGIHTLSWSAERQSSGIYFIRATGPDQSSTVKRIVLLK